MMDLRPCRSSYYIEQDGSFLGIKVHKEEVIQYEQRAPFDSLEFRFQCAFYFATLSVPISFGAFHNMSVCPSCRLHTPLLWQGSSSVPDDPVMKRFCPPWMNSSDKPLHLICGQKAAGIA